MTVEPGGFNLGFGTRLRRGLALALPLSNCDVFGKIINPIEVQILPLRMGTTPGSLSEYFVR